MPGFNHPGGLPPRPPTQEEIEAAQKRVVVADKRNAERLAEVALRNTKKAFKAPAPRPAQVTPHLSQVNDLPKDEGEEEVFTDDEKSILGEEEGGALDAESDV